MYNIAVMDIFAVLGDPTRREVLQALAGGPKAATQLAATFPISQPAVSRHLKVLREAGLIEPQRHSADGRTRMYRLRVERLREVDSWLQMFWQGKLDAFAAYVSDEG
jgi:DNA-binding transcriptional ArsR family regulator